MSHSVDILDPIPKARSAAPWRGALPWFLFACALSFFVSSIYFFAFEDEGDNLSGGRFIAEGLVIYKDFFSHHFPAPYLLASMVIGIFGPSIAACRFFLFLLLAGAFYLAGRRYRLLWQMMLGLCVWSAIGVLYFNHIFLYHSVAAPAVLLWFLTLLLEQPREHLEENNLSATQGSDLFYGCALGVAGALAVLSDPLLVYPLTIAALGLALRAPSKWRLGGAIICSAVVVVSGVFFWLLAHQAVGDFIEQAITFNTTTYAKFRMTDLNRWQGFVEIAGSFLGILKAYESTAALVPLSLGSASWFGNLDSTIWGQVAARVVVLGGVALLAAQRRWGSAVGTYLFFAALIASGHESDFHSQTTLVATIGFGAALLQRHYLQKHYVQRHYLQRNYALVLRGVVSLWFGVLLLFAISWRVKYWEDLSYEKQFGGTQRDANFAATLAHTSPNFPAPVLALFPSRTFTFFFTGHKPLAGFTYLWPWVAEYGEQKVLAALAEGPVVARVTLGDSSFGISHEIYLGKIKKFITENYFYVGEDFYVSPALFADPTFSRSLRKLRARPTVAIPHSVAEQFGLLSVSAGRAVRIGIATFFPLRIDGGAPLQLPPDVVELQCFLRVKAVQSLENLRWGGSTSTLPRYTVRSLERDPRFLLVSFHLRGELDEEKVVSLAPQAPAVELFACHHRKSSELLELLFPPRES